MDTNVNEEDEDNDPSTLETNNTNIACHRLALVPIFEEAVKELASKNIIETRYRQKKRMKRNHAFFLEINDKVSDYVTETCMSVSSLNITHDCNSLDFCIRYKQLQLN